VSSYCLHKSHPVAPRCLLSSNLYPPSPSFSPLPTYRSYNKRSSSAKWDADELTLVEKRTYKTQMGFGGLTPSSAKKRA